MSTFLKVAEAAARAGGRVLMDWFDRKTCREKGPKDFVTEADLASQDTIRQSLLDAFPDHGFLGEEGGEKAAQGDYRWIVDPLDGTTNYVHRLPGFAVSIALQCRARMIVGVVYDPHADECFQAELGQGAWMNGSAIRASPCQRLDQALVAASLSPGVSRGSQEIERFIEVLDASQSLRRLGSAALNLCYVAMGRLDAYWATSVRVWDVAAGVLILQEAGGAVSNLTGEALCWDRPELVAASQVAVREQLVATIRRADARRELTSPPQPPYRTGGEQL